MNAVVPADHARLQALGERLGDHFYVVDLGRFEANCRDLLSAFTTHHANTRLGYSYKTNYLPAMCRVADELGAYAEVVSGMEYELARRLDVPAERIIFNGPYKPADALRRALSEGAVVNLDSLDEVAAVVAMRAHPHTGTFRVGLRCHPGVAAIGSRFGLDIASGELKAAIAALRNAGDIDIVGLHCHVCPPKRQAAVYRAVTESVIDAALDHFDGKPPAVINMGGGFYSRMPAALAARWSFPIPSFEDYGEAIAGTVARRLGNDSGTELVIEPGVSVTADAMHFACQVVALKDLLAGRIAMVSGSVYNIKPTKNSANLPMDVVRQPAGPMQHVASGPLDVTGYTCMEDDVMFAGYHGELGVGDWLVFHNVGAYTNVLKPPFIRPAPAMAAVDDSGEVTDIVARAATFDDVFAAYNLAQPDEKARLTAPAADSPTSNVPGGAHG